MHTTAKTETQQNTEPAINLGQHNGPCIVPEQKRYSAHHQHTASATRCSVSRIHAKSHYGQRMAKDGEWNASFSMLLANKHIFVPALQLWLSAVVAAEKIFKFLRFRSFSLHLAILRISWQPFTILVHVYLFLFVFFVLLCQTPICVCLPPFCVISHIFHCCCVTFLPLCSRCCFCTKPSRACCLWLCRFWYRRTANTRKHAIERHRNNCRTFSDYSQSRNCAGSVVWVVWFLWHLFHCLLLFRSQNKRHLLWFVACVLLFSICFVRFRSLFRLLQNPNLASNVVSSSSPRTFLFVFSFMCCVRCLSLYNAHCVVYSWTSTTSCEWTQASAQTTAAKPMDRSLLNLDEYIHQSPANSYCCNSPYFWVPVLLVFCFFVLCAFVTFYTQRPSPEQLEMKGQATPTANTPTHVVQQQQLTPAFTQIQSPQPQLPQTEQQTQSQTEAQAKAQAETQAQTETHAQTE